MAAGRAVNTEDMGLKEAGVQLTDRGFIKVNLATLETTAPGVYCIGDVAGPPMLAHKGSREGVVRGRADRRAATRTRSTTTTSPASPTAIPRWPASGSPRSRRRSGSSTTRSAGSPSAPTAAPGAPNETEGFVKIIRDKKYGEILGAHIVGSHASELIHELAVARENEYTVEEVDLAIHAHPTLSEAIAEAALDSMGRVIHI